MVPTCNKCDDDKTADDFHRLGDGYQATCRACKKKIDATRYERSRPAGRRRFRPRHLLRSNIERLRSYKESNPCADCGHKFHFAAMDFDHRPGTEKVGNVASLVQKEDWDVVEREILKCDLVCSNCHRIRTYNRWHS